MPHTVPNSPTKGAVLPTDARKVRPDSRRLDVPLISWRSVRVTSSLRSIDAASEVSGCSDAACHARSASGANTPSGSDARSVAIASSIERAAQKRSSAARAPLRRRHALQAFDRMKYQLSTDMTSSMYATECVTASPASQKCIKPKFCSFIVFSSRA